MPLFEYECLEHGRHEYLSAEHLENRPCPACGQAARYVISSFAFDMAPVPGDLSTCKVNDSDSFWDGWSDGVREAYDRPNPLYYQSDKPFVDMGKE